MNQNNSTFVFLIFFFAIIILLLGLGIAIWLLRRNNNSSITYNISNTKNNQSNNQSNKENNYKPRSQLRSINQLTQTAQTTQPSTYTPPSTQQSPISFPSPFPIPTGSIPSYMALPPNNVPFALQLSTITNSSGSPLTVDVYGGGSDSPVDYTIKNFSDMSPSATLYTTTPLQTTNAVYQNAMKIRFNGETSQYFCVKDQSGDSTTSLVPGGQIWDDDSPSSCIPLYWFYNSNMQLEAVTTNGPSGLCLYHIDSPFKCASTRVGGHTKHGCTHAQSTLSRCSPVNPSSQMILTLNIVPHT